MFASQGVFECYRPNETLSINLLARSPCQPYPFYAQLRLQDPVHWDEEMGFWC